MNDRTIHDFLGIRLATRPDLAIREIIEVDEAFADTVPVDEANHQASGTRRLVWTCRDFLLQA